MHVCVCMHVLWGEGEGEQVHRYVCVCVRACVCTLCVCVALVTLAATVVTWRLTCITGVSDAESRPGAVGRSDAQQELGGEHHPTGTNQSHLV